MRVNVYARATKLHNVRGRIDYISNPERQEHLLATFDTVDREYWRLLAKDSQAAFREAGGAKTIIQNGEQNEMACCEAREFMGALPNSALERDPQELAAEIAAWWKDRTGAECIVALHQNKTMTQLHFHLIYSERDLLEEPEIRIADRNAFIDENGRRRRTKSEILDSDGQLRPGCRIIPKGGVISKRYFGSKNPMFADMGWLYTQKQELADWINQELDPDLKRTVFDKYGPYLPQKHIGNDKPEHVAKALEAWNQTVKDFNRMVDRGIISPDVAMRYKSRIALAPDQLLELHAIRAEIYSSMYAGSEQPEIFQVVLDKAAAVERTAEGPDEERKRKLREAYRKSHLAWQAYRKAEPGSLDQKRLLAEARGISAEITRLERELGYHRPRSTRERRQEVWDASKDIRSAAAENDELQALKKKLMAKQAEAWQELQRVRNEYEEIRDLPYAVRAGALENLNLARAAYADARHDTQVIGRSYQLLQQYRSYALQLASDPDVPQDEADRALEKYRAAARRLQNPTHENVKEMQRHLKDLQRSQQSRKEKAAAKARTENDNFAGGNR